MEGSGAPPLLKPTLELLQALLSWNFGNMSEDSEVPLEPGIEWRSVFVGSSYVFELFCKVNPIFGTY